MQRSPERTYTFSKVEACEMCGGTELSLLGRRLDHAQGLRPRGSGISVGVSRCSRCGLIFPNPLPRPASLEQHYAVAPRTYWPPEYFEVSPRHVQAQAATFRALWPGKHRPHALDVGAGIGKGLIALDREGFSTVGIEPSPEFRDEAVKRMGIDANAIMETAIEDADFPPESFDLIAMGAVLEHLYEPSEALAKAVSWLRPSGLIWVEVPSARWLVSRGIRAVYRAQGLDYVINLSPFHPPYHIYEFTLDSFRANGERNGYSIAKVRDYPGMTYLPERIPRFVGRGLQALMARTKTGMQLEVWLRR